MVLKLLKALIHERNFGDGIMSAIDFVWTYSARMMLRANRGKNPMSGKFLPYKVIEVLFD